jgi:hypothetical protein
MEPDSSSVSGSSCQFEKTKKIGGYIELYQEETGRNYPHCSMAWAPQQINCRGKKVMEGQLVD